MAASAAAVSFSELKLSAAEEGRLGELVSQIVSTDPDDIPAKLGPAMEHKSVTEFVSKLKPALFPLLGSVFRLPEHTVGFAVVLGHAASKCKTAKKQDEFLLHAANLLNMGVAEHLRAVPSLVGSVAEATAAFATERECSRAVLRPLRRAAEASAPHPRCLTPAHSAFAMLACQNKMYKDVCALADSDIVEVSPHSTGLTVASVLSYFFYAGSAYAAMKRWSDAVDAFAVTLCTPSSALSAVSIAAYKRRLLCALIGTGRAPTNPKAATSGALTGASRASAAYDRIATAFRSGDRAALEAALTAESKTLAADGLSGLARQLLPAQRRHRIVALTGTFVTVTLDELASKVGLPDAAAAEAEVIELVRSGLLRARVDQGAGVVEFLDEDATADPEKLARQIESLVGAAAELSEAVARREAGLVLSSDFIAHAATIAEGRAEAARREPGAAAGSMDADMAAAMAASMEG